VERKANLERGGALGNGALPPDWGQALATFVIPAHAGILLHEHLERRSGTPAFAGVTAFSKKG
jgi:hypothetical protein